MRIFKVIGLVFLLFVLSSCENLEVHNVNFHTNGGETISTVQIVNGYRVTEPSQPVKDGYLFEGWFSDSTLNVTYDFSSPVVNELDLYASWVVQLYSITFVDWYGVELYSESFVYGDSLNDITYPSNPNRPMYVFDGWDSDIPLTMPPQNIIITAMYTSELMLLNVDFYVSSTFDSYGFITDYDGNVLFEDDDSAGNLDFEIYVYLSPGTYYVVVAGYEDYVDYGSFTLYFD